MDSMNNYRHCDTQHLRYYPDCAEECDHEKCIGLPQAKPQAVSELIIIHNQKSESLEPKSVEVVVAELVDSYWNRSNGNKSVVSKARQILFRLIELGWTPPKQTKAQRMNEYDVMKPALPEALQKYIDGLRHDAMAFEDTDPDNERTVTRHRAKAEILKQVASQLEHLTFSSVEDAKREGRKEANS